MIKSSIISVKINTPGFLRTSTYVTVLKKLGVFVIDAYITTRVSIKSSRNKQKYKIINVERNSNIKYSNFSNQVEINNKEKRKFIC